MFLIICYIHSGNSCTCHHNSGKNESIVCCSPLLLYNDPNIYGGARLGHNRRASMASQMPNKGEKLGLSLINLVFRKKLCFSSEKLTLSPINKLFRSKSRVSFEKLSLSAINLVFRLYWAFGLPYARPCKCLSDLVLFCFINFCITKLQNKTQIAFYISCRFISTRISLLFALVYIVSLPFLHYFVLHFFLI